jgi:hypothetical protein
VWIIGVIGMRKVVSSSSTYDSEGKVRAKEVIRVDSDLQLEEIGSLRVYSTTGKPGFTERTDKHAGVLHNNELNRHITRCKLTVQALLVVGL